VIDLSNQDFVAIMENEEIGTSTSDTFMTLTAGAMDDSSGNDVIATTVGLAAYAVVDDDTAPTVTESSFDFNDDALTLSFSEPINASTVVPTEITFQNAASGASSSRQLTGGTVNVSATRLEAIITLKHK
jgi:hypothetical protein